MKSKIILVCLIVWLFSCESDETFFGLNQSVSIQFIGEDAFLIKNPELEITIYGYDRNWVDVAASEVVKVTVKKNAIPFSVDVELPVNPENKIEYFNGDFNEIRYYVSIEWDADNDRTSRANDIYIDYGYGFPRINLESTDSQIIVLKQGLH